MMFNSLQGRHRSILIVPCLFLTIMASNLHVRQNVIFDRVSEVSASRAVWKLTILYDLSPYDDVLQQTLVYIKRINKVAKHTVEAHNNGRRSEFSVHFSVLQNELNFINKTRIQIHEKFMQYHKLNKINNNRSRQKRSLIPIIGSIYSALFGLTTEKDLADIRHAINNLSENQQVIKHVVEEGLTIMNKSHKEIKENRQRINVINKGITELYNRMNRMADQTFRQYMRLQYFVYYYFQTEALVNNAQELVIELVHYYEDLKSQLDILSLGKITPSVITPNDFKDILLDIKNKLPKGLQLTMDPVDNLWSFYQIITSSATIFNNMIIIVLDIPLINNMDKMEIYRVINLPLPNLKIMNTISKNLDFDWVASYMLETNIFAIDKARTKYALLTKNDLIGCFLNKGGFCSFVHPLYPTNINKFCVIALFMQDSHVIQNSCQTRVRVNSILPIAKLVRKGLWVIALKDKLTFTITCVGGNITNELTSMLFPPLDKLELRMGCTAYSPQIILPSFNVLESQETIEPKVNVDINRQNFSLWDPFDEEIDEDKVQWNLSSLKNIPDLNMDQLINKLKEVKHIHVNETEDWSTYYTSVIIILIVISGLAFGVYYWCKKTKKNITIPSIVMKDIVKASSDSMNKKNTLEDKTDMKISSSLNEMYTGNGNFEVYPRHRYEKYV